MIAAWALAAAVVFARPGGAEQQPSRPAPAYTAASVVNAASHQPGALAPNTIATLYGEELSYVTRALRAEDVRDGVLPTLLAGSGVRVLVNNIPAHLYYVSPRQVNLLIPANLTPGAAELRLTVDGRAGPAVLLRLDAAAPAVFQLDGRTVLAVRVDGGELVTPDTPARPGEIVTLYATGLGQTSPPVRPGEVARSATALDPAAGFRVYLDGKEQPAANVPYAGLAPGFAGLYQVNLRVPEDLESAPELRMVAAGQWSPAGLSLPVGRR